MHPKKKIPIRTWQEAPKHNDDNARAPTPTPVSRPRLHTPDQDPELEPEAEATPEPETKDEDNSDVPSSTNKNRQHLRVSNSPQPPQQRRQSDQHSRTFRLRTKIPGNDATTIAPTCSIAPTICDLCFNFLEFALSRRKPMAEEPATPISTGEGKSGGGRRSRSSNKNGNNNSSNAASRFTWKRAEDEDYRWALYKHYTTVRMLRASARAGCPLCAKMLDCSEAEEDDQVAFAFSGEPMPNNDDEAAGTEEQHWYTFMICAVRPLATEFEGKNGFIFELALARDENDCLRMPFEGSRTLQRCPSLNPISEPCFQQIRRWRDECVHVHQGCARKTLRLPLRLLDLGLDRQSCATPTSPNNGGPIRLVSTTALSGEDRGRIRYVALSYCWGKRSENVVKKSNLAHFLESIELSHLPATVRDAIFVCRKSGIRYLWVDAYCICQDDKAEWEAEVSNMANVYGGAEFAISALASSTATEPFLRNRHLDPIVLGTVKVSYGTWEDDTTLFLRGKPRSLEDEFTTAAMNQRAWTLQEKILAPAVLHFGRDQLIWECNTGHLRSETGEISKEGELVIRTSDVRGADSSIEGVIPLWDCVLGEYTKRKLTFAGDRLVAIAGVASKLRKDGAYRGRYVAGLWETGLESQLVWHIPKIPRNKLQESIYPELQFPTWSWACRDLPIATSIRCYSTLEGVAKFLFLDKDQERRSRTETSAHYSAIKLRGFFQDVSERAILQDSKPVDRLRGFTTYPGLPGEDSRIFLDQEPMPPGLCYALRMVERPDLVESDGLRSMIFYLLLQRSETNTHPQLEGQDCYVRVGVLLLGQPPAEYLVRPYPDVYCKNEEPLLTNGEWKDVTLL